MPQLDGMSFFSQFIWFLVIFTNIYAFILKHVMCSVVTNLKFRIKKFDISSNILIADVKGLFYKGFTSLYSKYDFFVVNLIACSKSSYNELFYNCISSLKFPVQKFNNFRFLSAHAMLISYELNFKIKSKTS
jgi:hypothetical protein